ncbi:MAG: 50S ribosomal protein L17 [Lentisphaeria bacterium]|nr:50S ribosomal protein L17 [Lentisphaeria bacterium]
MRHRVHTFKVGRSSAHRRAMLANMVSSLFTNGQIQTTLVKAKEARRFAEKLITIGKKGDLHRRRLAVAKLRDKDAVKLLFDEIAPSYEGRNGGYTRILKLGVRRGDAAEMCILQLVKEQVEVKEAAPKAKAKKAEAKLEEARAENAKLEEAKLEEAKAEVEADEAEAAKLEEPKAE